MAASPTTKKSEMQKDTTVLTPEGKPLTVRLTTEARDASSLEPVLEIYGGDKVSDSKPGMYIGCYFLSVVVETTFSGSGLLLDFSRPEYCIDNEGLRAALDALGVLPDHTDPRVGDVVVITDQGSLGVGLHGIVMGEEAWLDDNRTVLWDGIGERPEFVGKTALGPPSPRRLLLHVYAAQEFRAWKRVKVLEARSHTISKLYPWVSERNMHVLYTPSIAHLLGSDMWAARTNFPFDVACVGTSEAQARLGIAETLKSHFPYPDGGEEKIVTIK